MTAIVAWEGGLGDRLRGGLGSSFGGGLGDDIKDCLAAALETVEGSVWRAV